MVLLLTAPDRSIGLHWSFSRFISGMLRTVFVLGAITACSEPQSPSSGNTAGFQTGMAIRAPAILSHRMIEQNALRLEYVVNGSEPELGEPQRDGSGNYSVTIYGAPEDTVTVDFTWLYEITETDGNQTDLPLASYQARIPRVGSQGQPVLIDESDYTTTGDGFDDDRDGESNLDEIKGDTNPFNSNVCTECPDDLDVVIPRISSTGRKPGIDGSYDAMWTVVGQFKDKQGKLLINNSIIGNRTTAVYRWGSLFDDENLYIIVLGRLGTNQHFFDSFNAVDDESIEIFITPDPRNENNIIGDDEYHFIIPMTGLNGGANSSGSTTSRFEQGGSSAMLPVPLPIEYATCQCANDNDIWELKIPLNVVGLAPGDHFGIEVQLNLDDDGGPRDAKWGWKDPTRDTTYINFTADSATPIGRALLKIQ